MLLDLNHIGAKGVTVERFTISLNEQLAEEFHKHIKARGYSNRSEAVRDMLRSQLESFRHACNESLNCVANLSYVYNHHERDLAERLTQLQHKHHHLTQSAMHVHLDHDNCIESVVLRGKTKEVRNFANLLIAQNGVRHGQLNLISVEIDEHAHQHGDAHSHRHQHIKPIS